MQRAPEQGDDTFLTTEDLAERWHTTIGAIHTMKHRGNGPKSVRIGKRNLYRPSDVEAYESQREQGE